MIWIECGPRHLEGIRCIFNEAIEHSTALYEYEPRSQAFMDHWYAGKLRAGLPVIGVENEDGVLMGFASYGPFRPHPAYKYTVEHSLYIGGPFRGQGLGRELLRRLIALAEQQGYHTLVGVIDAGNAASIALHEKFGFVHSGSLSETGFKFGRWLDLVFYQKLLSGPESPLDG